MTSIPQIVLDVRGPAGEKGALLLAPRDEALEWDLRHEIASTSRYWVAERQAWWIAEPYVPTLHAIVHRFHPGHIPEGASSGRPAPAPRPAPRSLSAPSPVQRLKAALMRALGLPWRRRGRTALAP